MRPISAVGPVDSASYALRKWTISLASVYKSRQGESMPREAWLGCFVHGISRRCKSSEACLKVSPPLGGAG